MIPVSEPDIGEKELVYVKDCLDSGWISSKGKYIDLLEKEFARYCGRKYAIAVNNGTNALIVALRALNLPKGSEIILPSFTIISCALACIYNELVPVFVDSEEDTWNISIKNIETKITKNSRAIMVVHIYGHPADMSGIYKIAKKYRLDIIEDFAEAIGSEYKKDKCGSFGKISCASFYANKLITTGEGGICLTDNRELAERIRKFKDLCFLANKRFIHYELGFNFRITNIQAAIGLAQLERIKNNLKKKRWIAKKYSERLKDLVDRGKIILPVEKKNVLNSYWMYGILLTGVKSVKIREKLAIKGIQTRSFFYPLHKQPVFRNFSWFKKEKLPIAERLYEYGLYLPSGLKLKVTEIERVVEFFRNIIDEF